MSNSTISGITTFYSNNGTYGGGIRGIQSNLTICGKYCFMDNTANVQGGGLNFINGTLNITGQSSFIRNYAYSDGSALFAFNSTITVSGNTSISDSSSDSVDGAIGLRNSIAVFTGVLALINNIAAEGGGFSISNSVVDFQGCIQYLSNRAIYNGGAIYARNSRVTMGGRSNCSVFQSNVVARGGGGGAIYAVDSSVYMTSEQNFIKNSATRGGALAFSGSSKLILTDPVQANFVENHATMDGGAFYITDTLSISQCTGSVIGNDREECFIELSSMSDIQFNFIHNTAGSAGTVIYGGSLDRCRLYTGGGVRNSCGNRIGGNYSNYPDDTIKQISKILRSDNNITSEISSDPLQIYICTDNIMERTHKEINVETIRGKEFTLSAVTVGQSKGIVPSSVRTSLTNDVQISAAQRIQSIGKECTPITYRLSTDKNTTTLILFPDGPCRDTDFSHRKINIQFLPCPDGFTLDGSECVCEDRLQRYTTNSCVDTNSIE